MYPIVWDSPHRPFHHFYSISPPRSLSAPCLHAVLLAQRSSIATKEEVLNLQTVSEQLVHLGKLGRDAEVDCPVANLDDETADDIGVDLRCVIRMKSRVKGGVAVQYLRYS